MFFIVLFFLIVFINSAIIIDEDFFALLEYGDYGNNFEKQKRNRRCSPSEGPQCYFVKSNVDLEKVRRGKEKLAELRYKTQLPAVKYNHPMETLTCFLTFESYDRHTYRQDYLLHERITFNFRYVSLNIDSFGELLLSFDNVINLGLKGGPSGTFGKVISDKYSFVFDIPVVCESFYIRKRMSGNVNVQKMYNQKVVQNSEFFLNHFWTFVQCDNTIFDTLTFSKDTEIDSLKFIFSTRKLFNYPEQYYSFFKKKKDDEDDDDDDDLI